MTCYKYKISQLNPDDIQGGTITMTNVGSFGNVMGTPIINQPQVISNYGLQWCY